MENSLQKSINPLKGKTGVYFFVLLVLFFLLAALFICSDTILVYDSIRIIALEISIIIVAFGWFTFAAKAPKKLYDFGEYFWVVALLGCPIILLVLIKSAIFFWISLLIVGGMAVSSTVDVSSKISWKSILTAIYVLWVLVGIAVTLGSTKAFPYAFPALSLSKIHIILDIRLMISSVMVLLFLIDSVVKAISTGRPFVPSLPVIQISTVWNESLSLVSSIMKPFAIVMNAFLLVLTKITESIWQLISSAMVYLYRIGKNLANNFIDVLLKVEVWRSILKALFTFIITIVFAVLVEFITPYLFFYLRSVDSFSSVSTDTFVSLLCNIGFFLLTFLGVLAINALWKINNEMLSISSFAGAMIVVALFLSADAMYGLARINILNITAFKTIGLFTFLILIIVGSVFVYQISQRIIAKLRPSVSHK